MMLSSRNGAFGSQMWGRKLSTVEMRAITQQVPTSCLNNTVKCSMKGEQCLILLSFAHKLRTSETKQSESLRYKNNTRTLCPSPIRHGLKLYDVIKLSVIPNIICSMGLMEYLGLVVVKHNYTIEGSWHSLHSDTGIYLSIFGHWNKVLHMIHTVPPSCVSSSYSTITLWTFSIIIVYFINKSVRKMLP